MTRKTLTKRVQDLKLMWEKINGNRIHSRKKTIWRLSFCYQVLTTAQQQRNNNNKCIFKPLHCHHFVDVVHVIFCLNSRVELGKRGCFSFFDNVCDWFFDAVMLIPFFKTHIYPKYLDYIFYVYKFSFLAKIVVVEDLFQIFKFGEIFILFIENYIYYLFN